MTYSLEKLLSPADCDTVLELAEKEKSDLDFRKISTQRNHDNFEDTVKVAWRSYRKLMQAL